MYVHQDGREYDGAGACRQYKTLLGSHITNGWTVLLGKTRVYLQSVAKMARNRTGDQTMFAYIMAMLLWNKQTMPATRIAFQDRKLDEEGSHRWW